MSGETSVSRLSSDQWQQARTDWESDPGLNATDIARQIGVVRTAVVRQISKGWIRQASFADLAEKAQLSADSRPNNGGGACVGLPDESLPSSPGNVSFIPDVSSESAKRNRLHHARAAAERAIDVRVEVIVRHRTEWQQHKLLLDEAIRDADFEKAKLAKITAETIAIRQSGERKAWGLDAYIEPTREVFPTIPDDTYAKVRQRAETERVKLCGPRAPEQD